MGAITQIGASETARPMSILIISALHIFYDSQITIRFFDTAAAGWILKQEYHGRLKAHVILRLLLLRLICDLMVQK